MDREEMITTYKEYEESIKNEEVKLVKGLGRLQAYQGLRYIELLCENDKYYSEELEDSFVGIVCYINSIEKENQELKAEIKEITCIPQE